VGCTEPEEDGGDGAVGSGAGLEEAGPEEGSDQPGPGGSLGGESIERDLFGHRFQCWRESILYPSPLPLFCAKSSIDGG